MMYRAIFSLPLLPTHTSPPPKINYRTQNNKDRDWTLKSYYDGG